MLLYGQIKINCFTPQYFPKNIHAKLYRFTNWERDFFIQLAFPRSLCIDVMNVNEKYKNIRRI